VKLANPSVCFALKRRAIFRFALAACLLLSLTGLAAAAPSGPSRSACTKLLKKFKLAAKPNKVLVRAAAGAPTVTSASFIPALAGSPEYCRVSGFIYTTNAAAPLAVSELNRVGFQLNLPTTWNRKLYFLGNGGYAGSIPFDPNLLPGPIERGYATAGTDTGHVGGDSSWAVGQPTRVVDYLDRGVHVATLAVKQLASRYYGSAPQLAYFEGCSNGGRQGVWEAIRYPDDFDGIVAGAPVDFQQLLASGSWNQQHT